MSKKDKLKYWNTLSEKLPKINKTVCIFEHNLNRIFNARLKVSIANDTKKELEEGDTYWEIFSFAEKSICWTEIEKFPYWMELEDLLKIIVPGEIISNSGNDVNRFQLMDLDDE